MTCSPHIDYVVSKCKRTLNLMRYLSGSTLGADKSILLTIYKTLILSQIDYCCFTYSECPVSTPKRLDTIQYKTLLITTGGMRRTALIALLGECSELPLFLRR